jgi:ferredoxin
MTNIAAVVAPDAATPTSHAIQFKKSGETINWCGDQTSTLDFAQDNGMTIPSCFRAGSCGTCQAVLADGGDCIEKPDFQIGPGTRLTCTAPKSDLVLDA